MMNSFLEKDIFHTIFLWFTEHGVRIAVIFALAYFLSKFTHNVIEKMVRKMISRGSFVSDEEEKKREDTIIIILAKIAHIGIWFGALFFVLMELGVPVAPLVTGASVLGVAVGFGAQSLIKDFITGIFIIVENQYRIGDVVCIGEYCGVVEDMTLRVTKLRNIDGTIHFIPNSEIKIASNKSKDFSMVDFKIGVAYHTDINHLEEVINRVGESIKSDPHLGMYILEDPHFLRIDDFGDSAIIVHIIGKVYPKKQYLITGEMKKRLKEAFEKEGIEIPYPTRVVYMHEHNA